MNIIPESPRIERPFTADRTVLAFFATDCNSFFRLFFGLEL